ncbi:dihydrolipoamide acetyltransferase family protein [Cytobacillus solani]|uniref:Dihydrolipoamide acetyltransferase component of pyruvate dehydrogenase complex n=1 Tax=Cytobacillus solani TaxID=1637975 RepID=A0A0Q3QMM1_9BACI|nr:dihydrolipoamide acetyltransferase family protein [Cytobacillus solani]KOP82351.1 dihydrolipoyllysine acetyltransferase [Bacillus sp. FJAT-21945]KQL19361.1 dihydrolipoyllysine acetyltransferase [Cytobacillus solani]USK57272.1 2-oxo acid dehydrogenase subunit E2 [Cytobacillus solani]
MEVKLHDIGEGMTEAEINCFLVKPGDIVQADDPLLEVQTDKMTAEIPSPRAGIIREFKVEPGQTVPVGTTLLLMNDIDGEVNKDNQKKPSQSTLEEKVPFAFTGKKVSSKRILASPYTRKIARENGINIEKVEGSGPSGRITDEDIYHFITALQETAIAPEINPTVAPTKTSYEKNTIPFRGRRKQIAKNMVQSMYTIPHCTHFEEVDVTSLLQFCSELKKSSQNISITAFFLKALSICLKEYPIFNAVLDEENEVIQLLHEHHIGVAVDMEEGLMVPVIQNVEKKSIRAIQLEMKQLKEKALENKLAIKDISGGTFTISNVGPLGGSFGATPIIQHPEVALVSFHKTKKMPVVTDEDQIVIRSIMNLSMSFDHRVADGATAVRFTNRFAALIQEPKMLLLEMV